MMPYTPIDTLRTMHRQSFEGRSYPDDPAAPTVPSSAHQESQPDPLGVAYEVALTRLRLGERLRAGIAWIFRLGRVGGRRPVQVEPGTSGD